MRRVLRVRRKRGAGWRRGVSSGKERAKREEKRKMKETSFYFTSK
jgi:hypothetical protein